MHCGCGSCEQGSQCRRTWVAHINKVEDILRPNGECQYHQMAAAQSIEHTWNRLQGRALDHSTHQSPQGFAVWRRWRYGGWRRGWCWVDAAGDIEHHGRCAHAKRLAIGVGNRCSSLKGGGNVIGRTCRERHQRCVCLLVLGRDTDLQVSQKVKLSRRKASCRGSPD